VSTRARIDGIEPVRTFHGRDRAGRLRKLRISDSTASMALTLWDEEVELVEKLGLKAGSRVRILSATLKETRYGREVHVGRSGFIVPEEVLTASGPPQKRDIKDLDAGRVIVRGVILSLSISGRGRNRSGRGRLFDGTGEVEVLFAEPQLEALSGVNAGTEIELSGAEAVSEDGHRFLRCDERSRIRIL
jgi:ssDNA-binding replication factor A large subunit